MAEFILQFGSVAIAIIGTALGCGALMVIYVMGLICMIVNS
jgi:hypothetical protein